MDWARWSPTEEATLLYVIRAGKVLLIEKKRGLGAGKINGPGGRVDPGESPQAAAVREFEEELRSRPTDVTKHGEVWFHVLGGPAIRIHVFRGADVTVEPRETAEAVPLWAPVDAVPYDRMWEDDRHWFPLLVAGRYFDVRTVFEGDRLLEWQVTERSDGRAFRRRVEEADPAP